MGAEKGLDEEAEMGGDLWNMGHGKGQGVQGAAVLGHPWFASGISELCSCLFCYK